ncbi:MAG: hypothetical protein V1727_03830 [Candidatus Omnitrophota bacterium]
MASVLPAYAGFKDIKFTNVHTARIAASDNDESLYLTRAAAVVEYEFETFNQAVKLIPFYEYQYNLDTDDWWRKEAGAEIGASFFEQGLFYYGASFQHVWQQRENYPVESLEETTEWESRFVYTPPLDWWLFGDKFKLHLFDEYTYDFTRGQFTLNCCGAWFEWKALDWLSVPVGWRHIDRVHDYDADTFEFSVLLSF